MITLETKVQILSDYWFRFSQEPDHADFIEVHDIGIPLAVLLHLGHATATPTGIEWIETDYIDLCEEFGVDLHGDYSSLDNMLEISRYE